jgi:hypothetical protein
VRFITAAVLDGYRRNKDKSVTVRFITQEKTSAEIAAIDELVDAYGYLVFQENEHSTQELRDLESLKTDFDAPKSKSQRLRGVLYRVWEKEGEGQEFESWYNQKMEAIIQHFKNRL